MYTFLRCIVHLIYVPLGFMKFKTLSCCIKPPLLSVAFFEKKLQDIAWKKDHVLRISIIAQTFDSSLQKRTFNVQQLLCYFGFLLYNHHFLSVE